jgi:hypothetical protein
VLDLCNISLVAFIMGERDTYVCAFVENPCPASLACGATANTDQHPAEWVNCRYSKCNAPVCAAYVILYEKQRAGSPEFQSEQSHRRGIVEFQLFVMPGQYNISLASAIIPA